MEKSKFEKLLGMETGYVLTFSNRSFAEFVRDSTGRDIYDERYDYASGSKANRLRAFWQKEENSVVGKLMNDMLDYRGEAGPTQEVCRLIVAYKDGALETRNRRPMPKTPNRSKSGGDLDYLADLRTTF
jgi:hypothetical protein